MRIQHNVASMNSYRNYNINNSSLTKNLEKLSSGYRVNRAGDDAAGLAVSEKMRAQITGLEGATRNAKDGIGLIQTAEGALQEVQDMLNRMYSIAEQSVNGTYTDTTDRGNLQMEYQALSDEIDRIGQTANFNGQALFDASTSKTLMKGDMKLAIGDVGGTNGSKNIITMKFSEAKVGGTAITSLSVSSLQLSSTSISTADNAKTALSKIKKAIDGISAMRGKLGAYQNRLEHTINNLGVMTENIQDAESRIRDTDVAEEMMKYTKNNILNQASQAMLAQANQMPQGVLQLLG